ncbi:MAG TPA: TldD/PmbA family protein [Actinomycetota bacterium]
MPGLIGADGFGSVADAALMLDGVDGVEVLFMHEWGGLTRFASSRIHQSTAREDTALRVRVISRDRTGVASTNDFSPEGARRAAAAAKEMAAVAAPDPEFPGLAPAAEVPVVDRYFDPTASATPEERAAAVERLVGVCPPGSSAAGAHETQAIEVGIANTLGQRCWAPSTQASLTTVVTTGDRGSGFAETFTGSLDTIDPEAVGRRAARKALDARDPRPLEPGSYAVVLEPAAVATLVGFLAYEGFGGRAYLEGRSCFSGRQDEQVVAPSISIWDDAADPRTLGMPFDFEGTPRRRVDLIRDGVFLGVAHDRRTARQAGTESTGHGLPPPNPEGPFPLNLFLAPGDATVEEMVRATDRGLLITRFHYSNIVNPLESSITGMTRDGTFLIERGEVVGPVMNLRFTQSIIGALSDTTMVGRETELASEFFFSASRVPALKIESFHFSGRSDH